MYIIFYIASGLMVKASAYSSGHISTVFRVAMNGDLLESGSRGAGVVIDEGVATEIELVEGSGIDVFFNGKVMDLVPTITMANRFLDMAGMMPADRKIVIRHESRLPLGAGFGVSAACVLGVGICLNEIFSLDMTLIDIGEAAHVTEIECGTGLGDVGPILKGGIEVRVKEGAFGHGTIENIEGGLVDIVCFSLGGLETKKVLGGDVSKINELADSVLSDIVSSMKFEVFMEKSLYFARKAGFMTKRLDDVIGCLNAVPGCFASQSMLGESGFVFVPASRRDEVVSILEGRFGSANVFSTKVNYEGIRVV